VPEVEHAPITAEKSRSVYGVGFTTQDRLHESHELPRIVLEVCVLHDDHVAARGGDSSP